MPALNGRVAIITGGTRGIGAALCATLAKNGAHVAAVFRDSWTAGEDLVRQLRGCAHSVSLHQGDVAEPDECRRVVGEVLSEHGQVDYLVNSAGIAIDRTVMRMSVDEWRRVIDVNLSGAFYMSKFVLPHMVDRQFGRIVNVSSLIADIGNIGQANYAASKAGMIGFSRSLALEVARRGVTVNCVAPGFIDTDLVRVMPPDVLESVVGAIPLRRLGTTFEVARAVEFLLDDDSSYVTGTVLAVNGGLDM